MLAELGGADGITVHLREDRRHIQDRDVEILRQVVKTRLNLEMAATQEMVQIALTVKPDQVTLVPERREELTTEGGLDVVLNSVQLKPVVKTLDDGGIEVSLFVDPDLEQVKEAHKLDAQAVEINTAAYADARDDAARARPRCARSRTPPGWAASSASLVHAGHGLTYAERRAASPRSPRSSELNIGHNIVARAVLVGMERAVREMAAAVAAALWRPVFLTATRPRRRHARGVRHRRTSDAAAS